MALDDAKFQMISGYLMANGIKIQGEDSVDNEFLNLSHGTKNKETKKDKNSP